MYASMAATSNVSGGDGVCDCAVAGAADCEPDGAAVLAEEGAGEDCAEQGGSDCATGGAVMLGAQAQHAPRSRTERRRRARVRMAYVNGRLGWIVSA
jgi:hypothetical protein